MVSYLDVATIDSTSHLDGRLSLVNRGGLSVLLEPGDKVFLVPPKIDVARSAHVESIQDTGMGKAIVKFREIDSIDAAQDLVGMHCLIEKAAVVDRASVEDFVAEDDFADWAFLDETTGNKGTIVRSWSASGNLLAEILLADEIDGATRLIPLAKDFIRGADDASKKLTLELPKGVFDL